MRPTKESTGTFARAARPTDVSRTYAKREAGPSGSPDAHTRRLTEGAPYHCINLWQRRKLRLVKAKNAFKNEGERCRLHHRTQLRSRRKKQQPIQGGIFLGSSGDCGIS